MAGGKKKSEKLTNVALETREIRKAKIDAEIAKTEAYKYIRSRII